MKDQVATPNPYEPSAAIADEEGDVRAHPHTSAIDHSHLPSLFRDRSFYGMTLTQFLGAFNDNLFKQLMLLLAVPIVVAAESSSATSHDQQGLATMVFSLPFLLFSGFAGFLSDRYSKRTIIVCAKMAEIAIMLLGMVGFMMYGATGYGGLLFVLFLMGTHSAFFGPGKYGILPELFRGSDLPRANGIVVMTTFLAIIFGTATAGILGDLLVDHSDTGATNATRLWIGSLACIGVAVIGTLSSLTIRPTPRAVPNLKFTWGALLIPSDTLDVLKKDRALLTAILASSMFWLVSGITVLVVNYVGMNEMGLEPSRAKTFTSLLNACTGLGIAGGAVLAGKLSRGKADFRLTRVGAWGIVVCLVVLGLFQDGPPLIDSSDALSSMLQIPRHNWHQLIGFSGSVPMMLLLGMFAAFFAIPVQVFIQARPKDDQKGRIIAVMNLANFTAILLSGFIYSVFDRLVSLAHLPHAPIFMLTAAVILPVAILYRPRDVAL